MSWRVKSSISSQYLISIFWLDLNTWVKNSDSTQILKSRILTQIESWRVENSTRPRWLNLTLMTQLDVISLVLWNFLNDFCQVYLDDILIYSKIRKKHKDHVKLVLSQLHEVELQINIWKYEFNIKETVFLKIIVSEQDLCMNSIVNWITLINLKEIQSFVKFVNFYHYFIKDFFKLVKSFTQLIRKNTSFV